MNILVLASNPPDTSPGSRFRIEQWARILSAQGFKFTYVPFDDEGLYRVLYSRGKFLAKAGGMIRGVLRRIALLRHVRDYDAVFVFQEASRIGPAVLERIIAKKRPMILDFCDPIYLPPPADATGNQRFRFLKFVDKTETICKLSSHVLVGNEELAAYARRFNPNVTVVPITIDMDEYTPRPVPAEHDRLVVIGWTGSYSTVPHLETVRSALEKLGTLRKFEIKVMGTDSFLLAGIPTNAEPWRGSREVPFLHQCDIGIMPLPDDPWVKLRSHLKVRQFMAVGVPCVASPVGIIPELIQDGVNGFLAGSEQEWIEKLSKLIDDPMLRRRMGEKARATVEEKYSGRIWAQTVASILREATGKADQTAIHSSAPSAR
jgi:glycosyltransferase involved in cell wall biosynthesis